MSRAENKMGVMPIPKLLITMALPMIISMLIQSLYNIVDSMYVNQISTEAFDALSIAFSVQNIMIGVATGTGVGVNALLSRSLGEKNYPLANKIAQHAVLLAFFGYLLFLIFGIFGVKFFYSLYEGKVTQTTIDHGITYLTIICTMSFGVFGHIIFERLMQATGRTLFTLFTQGTGAVINIILDPIMIFGLYGCPAYGVAGAAYATIIGQVIATILAIFFNAKFNPDISLTHERFRFDGKLVGRIYAIGVPSMLMMCIGSLMYFCMNQILGGIKQIGITVFGAYFKLQSFIFMPIIGMNNGIVPIVAYNYGAKNRARMMKTVKTGFIIAASIMFFGFLLMFFLPGVLLSIFETDASPADLAVYGKTAFKIISLHFVPASLCIVLSTVFQALGRSYYSMIVSFCRQLVVLIPAAFLLSLSGELDMVWWAYPIAEVASVIVSVVCFLRVYKRQIKDLPLGANAV